MSEPGTERGFTVRGIEPERHIYDFQITIDAEFADELRALDVPEKQEAAAEHIEESLTHDMADVRFVGDSFLLHGITVGFQATGLDLHKEELGRQRFATHNVDAPSEAIEVISAFSTWEEFATHLLEDRQEDDGLRADGGYPWNVRVDLGGVTFEGPGMETEPEAQAIKEIVDSSESVDGVQVIRQ